MLIKKILIAIDDSEISDHAAKYGFDIAHKFDAAVALVHIVEPAVLPYNNTGDIMLGSNIQDAGLIDMDIMNIQNDRSKKIIADTIKKFAGNLNVKHYNEFGNTADGIVSCSKEFKTDIIVIGTHSRTGLDRLLMGSVAEHVVRHSEVPVLVVPFPENN